MMQDSKMAGEENIADLINNVDDPELISKKVSLIIKRFHSAKENKDMKRRLVDELTDSNKKVEHEIEELQSSVNCQKEMGQVKTSKVLVEEMERVEALLKQEKAYLGDLEQQIREVDGEKLKLSKQNIKKQARQVVRSSSQVERSNELMKENLNVAAKHLSGEITKNTELREKIKVLMTERRNFNREYNELLDKLKCGKKLMEDLVSSIDSTFLKSKTLAQKMVEINSKEQKQLMLQEEEASELNSRKDDEEKLKHFYLQKSKHRKMFLSDRKTCKLSLMQKSTDDRLLQEYNRILLEITLLLFGSDTSMDTSMCQDAVKIINKESQEAYSLITFNTQLNHELEAMKDELANMDREIEEKSIYQEEKRLIHEEEVKYLESYRDNLENKMQQVSDDLGSNQRDLVKLFRGVENLIDIIKADVSPLLLLLGENSKITIFNYKLFLQALESKQIKILQDLGLQVISRSFYFPKAPGPQKHRDLSTIEDRIMISSLCKECHPQKPGSKVKLTIVN